MKVFSFNNYQKVKLTGAGVVVEFVVNRPGIFNEIILILKGET